MHLAQNGTIGFDPQPNECLLLLFPLGLKGTRLYTTGHMFSFLPGGKKANGRIYLNHLGWFNFRAFFGETSSKMSHHLYGWPGNGSLELFFCWLKQEPHNVITNPEGSAAAKVLWFPCKFSSPRCYPQLPLTGTLQAATQTAV